MIKVLTALLLAIGPISATAEVIEVESYEHHMELVKQGKPMVVMFGADWCGYCKEAKPEFVKAEKLYNGKVMFVYIDVDKNPVPGVPYLPSYAVGGTLGKKATSIFLGESLNQNKDRDVNGIIEYVERYTGVKP